MKKCRLFLTTAFLLGCLFFANAAKVVIVTSTANSGTGSLRTAITSSASKVTGTTAGDTIRFHKDLEDETIELDSKININRNLVIDGEGNKIELSGKETDLIFNVNAANVTILISNLTLKDGYAAIGGGAVACLMQNISATFTNVHFINNKAVTYGAAIDYSGYQATTTIKVNNCYFSGNETQMGGAINSGNSTLIVSNSTFENNSASSVYEGEGGGAIAGKNVTVTGSVFKDNKATVDAGAIWLDKADASARFFANTFIGNSSEGTSASGSVLSANNTGTANLAANIFQDNTSGAADYNEFYHKDAGFTITSNGYNVFKGASVPPTAADTWTSAATDAFYDGDIVDAATGKLVTNPPAVVTISETADLIEGLSKPAKDIWGNTWGTPYNAGADQTRTATPVALSNPETAAVSVSVRYGNITVSGASAGSTVKVYNLQGQLLKTQQVSAEVEVLKTAAWPKGIYVVVVDGDQQEVLKEKVVL
jgi:hypothetical protein